MSTHRARLVVVIGPIAAGKSTVCGQLSSDLVAAGLTVASVDVDEVAAMVRAPGGRTEEHWEQAHRAHGALVGGWLDSAVDVVLAHGPVFTRQQTEALMTCVPGPTRVLRVLLLSSYASALGRVRLDPERGLSKDPDFLRASYDRFSTLRAGIDPCDLTFDTDLQSVEHVAAVLAAQLLDPAASAAAAEPGS